MQQLNMKLDSVYSTVLSELNLGTHLLLNRYASSTQTKLSESKKPKILIHHQKKGAVEQHQTSSAKTGQTSDSELGKLKNRSFENWYSVVRKREKLAEGKRSSDW